MFIKPHTVSRWLLSAISLSTKKLSRQMALCKEVEEGAGVSLSTYKQCARLFNSAYLYKNFLDFVNCFYMHPTSQVHFFSVYKTKHSYDSVGILVPSANHKRVE